MVPKQISNEPTPDGSRRTASMKAEGRKPSGKAQPIKPTPDGLRRAATKETTLMADLVPLLKKRAGGRDIAGLKAYEE